MVHEVDKRLGGADPKVGNTPQAKEQPRWKCGNVISVVLDVVVNICQGRWRVNLSRVQAEIDGGMEESYGFEAGDPQPRPESHRMHRATRTEAHLSSELQ